jgi:hypothetical protein
VILAKSTETGFTYSMATNEEGLYRLPYLNPGTYEISYEAQGFKKLVRTGIEVRSTETARVDVTLEVGNVTESVQVTGQAALLETETSMAGHLVDGIDSPSDSESSAPYLQSAVDLPERHQQAAGGTRSDNAREHLTLPPMGFRRGAGARGTRLRNRSLPAPRRTWRK